MEISIEHAVRAQWALVASAKDEIRQGIQHRRKGGRHLRLAQCHFSTAKHWGQSANAFRAAIEAERRRRLA